MNNLLVIDQFQDSLSLYSSSSTTIWEGKASNISPESAKRRKPGKKNCEIDIVTNFVVLELQNIQEI